MKKILRNAVIALALAALLGIGADTGKRLRSLGNSPFSVAASGAVTQKEPPDGDAAEVFAPSGNDVYILRETDGGKIGVFLNDKSEPEFVVDIFVFTLPDGTAELLRQGIKCDSETLSSLIDSFTS